MEWKIIISTFIIVFLAELGDKTQLASILMTSKTKKPVLVFAGTMLAFAVVTALGVAAGSFITRFLPLSYIKGGAAIAFIIIGILILFGKI
ncbi:MAG: TMEM165/GDT1 family protein [Candidatus Loosdrechtia sp.]|uniref:TMEM165/GDT1 family protein n=1 Tax=Candidatus Loosdrechtia sp. TaxID=3101272 RepID=UPI003A769B99|nr:MAG: TMEM165/GDT1 family protein [Candidatus Jettenia sp. AMX2]